MATMTSLRNRNLMSAIIVFVILYRAFWGLIIATSFVPDEYYQTIEPAFNLTFGDSDLGLSKTWEWNDDYRIRSFVLLLPYLLFFQFKRLLTDHFGVFLPTIIVSRGPRLIQSLLTAYSDTLLYIIMQKISGSNYFAGLALIVHLLAWSASYCLSRTLANSTETALLIIGIYFFIKETNLGDLREDDIKIITDKNAAIQDIKNSDIAQPEMTTKPTFWKALLTPSISIALVVITVHSRPTAVLFWAPLILLKTVYHKSPLRYVFFECIPTGLFVFLSCIGFDSYCYGEITITPYNFFRINISHNYAVLYYGAKPWYWNFSNGLPVMLGLYTPFLMYSFLFTLQHTEAIVLELIAFLYIILLSSITAHQEYRFLLPCLPFLHIAVGYTFWDILTGCFDFLTKESLSPRSYTVVSYCISSISLSISYVYDTLVTTAGFTTVQGEKSQINQSKKKDKSTVKKSVTTIPCRKDECKSTIMKCFSLFTLACVIVLHFITALYLSRRHQRGTEASYFFAADLINRDSSSDVISSPLSSTSTPYPNSASSLPSKSNIVVLLLSPCHAFPGYSLLSLLTEKSGRKIELLSLDCSPSPLKSEKLIDLTDKNDSSSEQCLQTATKSCTNAPIITQSKQFENSPNEFINEKNHLWSTYGNKIDYILTFNSYYEDLRPILSERGFQQVADMTHADFRYDYDDPLFHQAVVILYRKKNDLNRNKSDLNRNKSDFKMDL